MSHLLLTLTPVNCVGFFFFFTFLIGLTFPTFVHTLFCSHHLFLCPYIYFLFVYLLNPQSVFKSKYCCCCVASVVSDSMRPHRRQPTRLPRPWDSPGKSTGVGCHCLLQCMKVKSESEIAQSCPILSDPMDCGPTRLLHPWDFPGKSAGVGCHCLLRRANTTSPENPSLVSQALEVQNHLSSILCNTEI